MKKKLNGVVGALLLTSAAASVALVGGSTPSFAAGTPSSAYGIEATGPNPIPATPSVTATDGSPVTDSAASIPENPVLTGGLLEVSARNGAASASLADLAIGDGLLSQLPAEVTSALGDACDQLAAATDPVTGAVDDATGELTSGLEDALNQIDAGTGGSPLDLSALAELDLEGLTDVQLGGLCDVLSGEAALVNTGLIQSSCTGSSGDSSVAALTALGLPVNVDTEKPNSSVTIPGLLSLTLDRQTANPDGTFTVDALVLNLFDQEEIVIASATCGRVTNRTTPNNPTPDAPAPAPVPGNLPVTG